MENSRALKIISFSESEANGRDLRGRFNYNDKITFGDDIIDTDDSEDLNQFLNEEWGKVIDDYITLKVIGKVYQTVANLIEKGYNAEVRYEDISEKEIKKEFKNIIHNVDEIKKMYKNKIISDQDVRDRKVWGIKSLLILDKAKNKILDDIQNRNGYFHVVTGKEFTKGEIDVITSINKVAIANITQTKTAEKLGTVPDSKVFHEILGFSIQDNLDKDKENLIIDYQMVVRNLNNLKEKTTVQGDVRAMLGTILSNIQKDKNNLTENEEDYDDIKQVKGSEDERNQETDEDESLLDIKLKQYKGDTNGFNMEEILGDFGKESDKDVYGIKNDVIRLVKKDKIKEVEETENESQTEKELGSNQDSKTSDTDGEESVSNIEQETQDTVEVEDELNFRAIDKFYSILSQIKKRSPSKELYDTLKKGNIEESVIIRFMNCKNIDYYDYLDIESIVDDKFGNKG